MRCSPEPINSDDDSGTSSDVPDVFSDGAVDDSSESASELDSSGDNSDDSNDDSILDEEEEQELSALHYLQEAESLDVSQLRQKRYSPKTQSRLNDTRDYWDR